MEALWIWQQCSSSITMRWWGITPWIKLIFILFSIRVNIIWVFMKRIVYLSKTNQQTEANRASWLEAWVHFGPSFSDVVSRARIPAGAFRLRLCHHSYRGCRGPCASSNNCFIFVYKQLNWILRFQMWSVQIQTRIRALQNAQARAETQIYAGKILLGTEHLSSITPPWAMSFLVPRLTLPLLMRLLMANSNLYCKLQKLRMASNYI